MPATNTNDSGYTIPGLSRQDGHKVAELLQARLHALNGLALTLKHAHWNVVGRDFIGGDLVTAGSRTERSAAAKAK